MRLNQNEALSGLEAYSERLMRDTGRPLRVLHLTAGSDAGGLSRYIFDLSSAMLKQGHDVHVAGERGAWHPLFEHSPIPWIDLPFKGGLLALRRAVKSLDAWLDANPVDVLHAHYRRPTLVARRLRHLPPILYTVHLSDLQLTFPWRLFSDFGDHTHVASVEARRWVIEDGRIPPERVSLIPHGIDVARFPHASEAERAAARASFGLPPEARVAAFVSRLDYPKNPHWLIDVAMKLPDLHILVAGEGPDKVGLRAGARAAGVASRFHILGHREPLPVYQAADALLLPSLREGFSLVCAEAMSVGTPIFRTRTAGTEELVVENVTGRSCAIDREAFVRGAVEFLTLDSSELRAMGMAGSQLVREKFTFDRQLQETLALYAKVATLKRS